MLCCVCPPNFEKALQVCPAASPVAVHTLGCWRHNGLDLCVLCQVLQGAGSNSKPAQVVRGIISALFWSHIMRHWFCSAVLDGKDGALQCTQLAVKLLGMGKGWPGRSQPGFLISDD